MDLINDERYGRREEGLVVVEGEAVTQLVSTVSTGSPGPPLTAYTLPGSVPATRHTKHYPTHY